MTLVTLCALCATSAFAQDGNSRLQVTMDRPVGLMVDGRMQEVQENSMTYLVDALQPGRHEVSLRAMFGKELANVFVDIPESAEVRCRYRRKQFECYDTIALAPIVETVILEPAIAVVETAPTEIIETTTVTTTGVPAVGHMPGNVGGNITMSGPDGETVSIGVQLGGLGGGLGGDLAMDSTITETTTITTTHSEPQFVETVAVAARPSKVSLVVRNTDGEWADFLVDGKVVAEFRNEEEIKVTVSPGTHTIEVREFMQDKGYTRAKIDTGVSSEVIVGLTEGQPIECFNHEGCQTNW